MRTCVMGAGAIGCLIGGKLVQAGVDVTFVGMGDHFERMRSGEFDLVGPRGERSRVHGYRTVNDPALAGRHELVILAVKAYDIAAVAPDLPALYGREGMIMTVQNGIPWWYFQKHGGPLDGRRLSTLDPEGRIERNIPADRIVGSVTYPAAEIVEPGVVRHVEGNAIPVGELDGRETYRLRSLSELLARAGFKSRILEDIRSEIWLKAWGSLTFNPLSALTGATMEEICRFPAARELVRTMMAEAHEICRKLGVSVRRTIEQRIAGAEKVGPHKTSMLQDVEAGRRLEIDALIGVILELGRLTETPTPAIEAVHACAGLLDAVNVREARQSVVAA